MPMNLKGKHWFLIVFHFKTEKLFVLDSLAKDAYDIARHVQWVHLNLEKLFPHEYGTQFDIRNWPIEIMLENVPQQPNL